MAIQSDYEKNFQLEIEAILNALYHEPIDMGDIKIKRQVFNIEKRFVDYLTENKIVSNIGNLGGGKYGLQLESNGYEVFEKYNGWLDYKKHVIDKKEKILIAKNLSIRFWWLPIVISILALIISVIALFNK